ncbi:MAG: hypothetical protein WCD80_02760 [Desulfobaccales bacterium]
MKLKNIILIVLLSSFVIAIADQNSMAGEAGPVPPCPWPVKIEPPPPGTSPEIAHLLGFWTGECTRNSWKYRNNEMYILSVKGQRAKVYWGRGIPAGVAGNPTSGWSRIENAEILTNPLRLKWQWERTGKMAMFELQEGRLVWWTSDVLGYMYETTLTKSN